MDNRISVSLHPLFYKKAQRMDGKKKGSLGRKVQSRHLCLWIMKCIQGGPSASGKKYVDINF